MFKTTKCGLFMGRFYRRFKNKPHISNRRHFRLSSRKPELKMAEVGNAASSGEKELKTNYPVEDGLIAGTTKQTGHKESLEAQEKSLVLKKEKVGV
jgi:hypothetical protein